MYDIARQVECPLHKGIAQTENKLSCAGERVEARIIDSEVRVAPCSSLKAQGWDARTPQLVGWLTMSDHLFGEDEVTYLRHGEGLVSFKL